MGIFRITIKNTISQIESGPATAREFTRVRGLQPLGMEEA
jgi:hypothetical protein